MEILINGMGLIGRELFRTLWDMEGIEITALNDVFLTPQNLAYLLKYDSIYHSWTNKEVSATSAGIVVNGKEIPLYSLSKAEDLPLGKTGTDIVIECTGNMGSKDLLQAFLNAGARRVMACYYAGNNIPTMAYDVNLSTLKVDDDIIAFAPMETQVLSNALNALSSYNIKSAFAKAFRSYSGAQSIVDGHNAKSFAQGRAAAWNISPIGDAFAKYVGLVIPALNGKVLSFAYRAPIINGNVMDITLVLQDKIDVEEINAAIKGKSYEALGYSEEPLCSTDALGMESPQLLSASTMTIDIDDSTTLVSLSIVYDNVRGYCLQIKRFLERILTDNEFAWRY